MRIIVFRLKNRTIGRLEPTEIEQFLLNIRKEFFFCFDEHNFEQQTEQKKNVSVLCNLFHITLK